MKKKLINPSIDCHVWKGFVQLVEIIPQLLQQCKETNESPNQQRPRRKTKTGSRSNGNKRK